MSSRVWMVLSNWPLVYGWCVVLRSNLVPRDFCKLTQNWDVNWGSLSSIILVGTLCNFTITLMYNLVSFSREKSVLTSMKCANLVKRSTMTQMALFLLNIVSNLVTKSMVILSHFHSGTSNGCISRRVFDVQLSPTGISGQLYLSSYPSISIVSSYPGISLCFLDG